MEPTRTQNGTQSESGEASLGASPLVKLVLQLTFVAGVAGGAGET